MENKFNLKPSAPKQPKPSQIQKEENTTAKWLPKDGEIVFSVRLGKDFRFSMTRLVWRDSDKLLQKAFERGIIFKYADEAFELSRKMDFVIEL